MSTRIVHYGLDECSRIPTLVSAGYLVEDCGSVLPRFSESILNPDLGAIAVSESAIVAFDYVVELARTSSKAPLVLFQDSRARQLDPANFDLLVRAESHPEQWLANIGALIERSRTLREISRNLRSSVQSLHTEILKVTENLRAEVMQSESNFARVLIKFPNASDWFNASWIFSRLRNLVRPMFPDPHVNACLERADELGLLDFAGLEPEIASRVANALRMAAERALSSPANNARAVEAEHAYRAAMSELLGALGSTAPPERRVLQLPPGQFPVPRRRKTDRTQSCTMTWRTCALLRCALCFCCVNRSSTGKN